MLGALLSLLSAATFGLNTAMLRRGVLSGSVLQAMAITVPIGVPLFALAALLFGALGDLATLSRQAWLWFSVAGVIHFVAGRYGTYRATRALGANLSGPLAQISLVVSVLLALLFLGERLSLPSLIGMALILLGPLVMVRRKAPKAARPPSGFVPNHPEGLLWGFVGAVGYGASPLFVSWGLSGGGVGESLLGGLVSYGAAAVVVLAVLVFPGQRRHVAAMGRGAAGWFVLAGLFVFVSQMLRYAALALAPVSVVAPIQRLAVVFRLLFSWLLNREHESFGGPVLAGIALSLLGAALLTVPVDRAAMLLPEALHPALEWRWP